MKIWEKINNITGNDSKSRYLVPYINAGSKFLLSALPEKFLWTIASESEITGWDTDGVSQIGSGSSIAYDKVLAVYRLDGGKKRVCAEAPDKNIHIFDEASSLLKATKMFPKFYKLSGKIYIKPDPDYNNQTGDNDESYTELGASSATTVSAGAGDKGVIVYSAPPIVDENTDSWILAEYENIVLFYAASLDHFRLASVYRDLCKAQIDAVASGVLTFSISSTLPLTMNLTTSLPTFSFTSPLPTDISISSSLPSGLNVATSLPSIPVISTNLPSDFSTDIEDIDTIQELAHSFDIPSINDALIKAQQLIDGSVTTNNAQEWLDDEDSEMTAATIGVANAEISRAQSTLQREQGRLEEFSSKVNQKLSKYQNDVGNYSAKVQKEATRMSSQLGKLQREVEKKVQIFSSQVSKYQAEIAKESARTNIDVANYSTELGKEKTRVEFALAKWQADLAKSVQDYTLILQAYQAEVQKEIQRINGDITKYQAEISKSSKDLEKQVQQFTLDIQAAGVYTTKSQHSIQTSGMFYQRAINELSAITGAITAPEQQQSSQRAEQGAST
jgi:Skp family chaperone for outer membrane proteins